MDKARNSLLIDFVPKYLGFENIKREQIIEHNTVIVKNLFLKDKPESIVNLWDGTNVYIQKS